MVLNRPGDSINTGIFISIALHGVLLFFFAFKSLFIPKTSLILEESMRVDLVALPDKVTPQVKVETEKAPPAKKSPPPPPKKVKKKVNLKQARKQQSQALNRLKALSALDKLKNPKPSKRVAKKESSPPKEYKGNILAAGTSLTGVHKIQHNRYLGQLKNHVQKNWFLPEWLAQKDLRAQIQIKIDKTGNLLEQKLIESSGDATFDELASETVKNSDPFPAPPEKFQELLKVDGFVLGFPR